jgi:hypothetical protein
MVAFMYKYPKFAVVVPVVINVISIGLNGALIHALLPKALESNEAWLENKMKYYEIYWF